MGGGGGEAMDREIMWVIIRGMEDVCDNSSMIDLQLWNWLRLSLFHYWRDTMTQKGIDTSVLSFLNIIDIDIVDILLWLILLK